MCVAIPVHHHDMGDDVVMNSATNPKSVCPFLSLSITFFSFSLCQSHIHIIMCEHESGVQGKCITNKATPTRTTSFSKAALGGTRTHDTLLTRQSALPTELPGQLSKQGSKSTTQHNTTQDKVKPQYSVLWHRRPSLNNYISLSLNHTCTHTHTHTLQEQEPDGSWGRR